jgi:hypothetical protein
MLMALKHLLNNVTCWSSTTASAHPQPLVVRLASQLRLQLGLPLARLQATSAMTTMELGVRSEEHVLVWRLWR